MSVKISIKNFHHFPEGIIKNEKKRKTKQNVRKFVRKFFRESTPKLLTPCLSVSGKWDSNPRPSAWEADALPTELLPQLYWYGETRKLLFKIIYTDLPRYSKYFESKERRATPRIQPQK